MMTDTQVTITDGNSYSNYVPNHYLNSIAWEVLKKVRSPVYTNEERELAARLRRTFTDSPEGSADTGTEFSEEPVPYQGLGGCLMASTDVGDVSLLVPSMQLYTTCCAAGTPGHSWQMVSQTGCSIGEKGMITAANVLALTALELIEKPELILRAWEKHEKNK